MGRTCMTPVGQEEELMDVVQCEDADKVRENFLKLAEAWAAAEKSNFRYMVESDPTDMALTLAEVSARPDAPKTYQEWRNWLREEHKCDT